MFEGVLQDGEFYLIAMPFTQMLVKDIFAGEGFRTEFALQRQPYHFADLKRKWGFVFKVHRPR